MQRYETKIEDDVLYVESDDGWLEVGAIGDILDLVGGEEYRIQYDRQQAAYAEWLDTDEDNVLTIDVRETLADMSYPAQFVTALGERDARRNGGPSERTRYFADIMTDIWESKGDLDDREDNPFQQ